MAVTAPSLPRTNDSRCFDGSCTSRGPPRLAWQPFSYCSTHNRSVGRLRLQGIVTVDDTAVALQLGGDAVPVPEPVMPLLTQHLDERRNTKTAANVDSRWLFPGYRPVTYAAYRSRSSGPDQGALSSAH